MPSTVQEIFGAADLAIDGSVTWGTKVPQVRKGVYSVALKQKLETCPISPAALEELMDARKELTLDGQRPDIDALSERLAAFWLSDEVVLYIGLAGTSLQTRVGQYYRTRLGARSPHAGGWFLKTLFDLPALQVHYASCGEPQKCEEAMLASFSANVSEEARVALHDPDQPIPFANLEWPKRRIKKHRIKGAKKSRHRA